MQTNFDQARRVAEGSVNDTIGAQLFADDRQLREDGQLLRACERGVQRLPARGRDDQAKTEHQAKAQGKFEGDAEIA